MVVKARNWLIVRRVERKKSPQYTRRRKTFAKITSSMPHIQVRQEVEAIKLDPSRIWRKDRGEAKSSH